MKRELAAALALALASQPALAADEEETKSLYERLGGLKHITPVVEDFVDRLLGNPTIARNPAIGAVRRHSPPSYLKFQLSQLVCEMSGGPCLYTGLAMKESHLPLNIGPREWEAMGEELKKSLDRFKVPEVEQREIFELFGETRGDIVASQDKGQAN